MIEVTFTLECVHFMRDLEVSQDHARATINDRHQEIIILDRIIAAHWFDNDYIMLVEGIVQEKEHDKNLPKIKKVLAQLVLVLRSLLPAGTLTRGISMERLLAIVAESFGALVVCYPGETPTKLYSGPFNGECKVQSDPLLFIFGTNYKDEENENRCESVWAFRRDLYGPWLAKGALTGSMRNDPLPSRMRLEPRIQNAKKFVREFPRLYSEVSPNPEAIQCGLASKILQQALGKKWYQRNFLSPSNAAIRNSGADGIEAKKIAQQQRELGELVFNLQTVPGFNAQLENLKTKDFASTLAELQAAKCIIGSELEFSFVKETNRKGLDYEGKIILPTGVACSCDVKSKREDTLLTKGTILNSLKTAGKQVPKDAPLIVFLKHPGHWMAEPNPYLLLKTFIDWVTSRFFRDYSRAVAVVFFVEIWQSLPNMGLTRVLKFKEISNQKSRFYDARNTNLIRSVGSQSSRKSWVSFSELP